MAISKSKVKSKVKTSSKPKKIKDSSKVNLVKGGVLGALGLSVLGAGLLGINKIKKNEIEKIKTSDTSDRSELVSLNKNIEKYNTIIKDLQQKNEILYNEISNLKQEIVSLKQGEKDIKKNIIKRFDALNMHNKDLHVDNTLELKS